MTYVERLEVSFSILQQKYDNVLRKINDIREKDNKTKTAGSLTLIFDEQKAASLDKYSVDFKSTDVAIAYDDATDSICVSVGDRDSGVMRFYNVVDGELALDTIDEDYC